jgi:hypothetical protein
VSELAAMFPLGSVLLPHMPLPLQLFEQRYLMMLGRLLDSDDPQFGVVLIERGLEVGGGEQRLDVGTLARVVEVDPRAGVTGVLAIGTNRIRVTRWLPDDPYPRAEVEVIPELDWWDSLGGLLDETESAVRALLASAAELAAGQARTLWPPDVSVSEDPVTASWQLAAITPLGPLDHYDLLRAQSCEELLVRTRDLARDAAETAALMRTMPPDGGLQ